MEVTNMQILILIFPLMAAILDQQGYIHAHKFHHAPIPHILMSAPLPPNTEVIYFVTES